MKARIAFDLDETLGITLTDSNSVIGFHIRDGCTELLERLKTRYHLVLWTVSTRIYLNKVLCFGLADYFQETWSWDEISGKWKDIRRINVKFLIDDSEYHREAAKKYGLESNYIIIPAYGSKEDQKDSLLWARQVKAILL